MEKSKSRSYQHRKDNRTDEQFAHDMKYAHQNERILMEHYVELKKKEHPDIHLEDNGVDNTGGVIFDNTVSKSADFKVIIGGEEHLMEVKNCPVGYKASFKKEDLDAYHEKAPDNFSLLVFVGTDMWVKNNKEPSKDTRFFIVPKKDIPLLKAAADYNKNRGGKSFGGKPIYILKEEYFSAFDGPEKLFNE